MYANQPEIEDMIRELLTGFGELRFTQLSKAWYAEANLQLRDYTDEITIGYYCNEDGNGGGGTRGEFGFRWHKLNNDTHIRMEAFTDSWATFPLFKPLFDRMVDISIESENRGSDPTPDEFVEMLTNLGYINRTPVERDNTYSPNIRHDVQSLECFAHIIPGWNWAIARLNIKPDADWLQANCQHPTKIVGDSIWFVDQDDAMLAQMRFM